MKNKGLVLVITIGDFESKVSLGGNMIFEPEPGDSVSDIRDMFLEAGGKFIEFTYDKMLGMMEMRPCQQVEEPVANMPFTCDKVSCDGCAFEHDE